MTDASAVEGVLITGVYGTGKSSVAAEIAETLERRRVPYGALDLDWLTWFDVPGLGDVEATDVYLRNVAAVVANYRTVGVSRFVLAGALFDRDELHALQTATGMPLRVVRLDVPLDEITRRLADDPTTERPDNLRVAAEWLRDSVGVGLEDVTISNQGPIQAVANRIIDWLGWTT